MLEVHQVKCEKDICICLCHPHLSLPFLHPKVFLYPGSESVYISHILVRKAKFKWDQKKKQKSTLGLTCLITHN